MSYFVLKEPILYYIKQIRMALKYLLDNNVEFAENIVSAKNLRIYEYYDSISIQCDKDTFYIKSDDSDVMIEHYHVIESFVSDYLHSLNNLELLSFTSRFPSESSYDFIKSLPSNLKTLHLDHSDGLSFDILPNHICLFVNCSSTEQDQSVDNIDDYDYYEDFVKQIDINSNSVSNVIDDSVFLNQYLSFK